MFMNELNYIKTQVDFAKFKYPHMDARGDKAERNIRIIKIICIFWHIYDIAGRNGNVLCRPL